MDSFGLLSCNGKQVFTTKVVIGKGSDFKIGPMWASAYPFDSNFQMTLYREVNGTQALDELDSGNVHDRKRERESFYGVALAPDLLCFFPGNVDFSVVGHDVIDHQEASQVSIRDSSDQLSLPVVAFAIGAAYSVRLNPCAPRMRAHVM